MNERYFYHVVTEKPMKGGQIIRFDHNHFNGVYDRVMACKKILDGQKAIDPLEKFIQNNLEYWAVRTYRELALEKVRKEKYPNYPSRMACLYTSRAFSDAKMWAAFFQNSKREVLQIVTLQTDGHIFDGDANNVFDGTEDEIENEKNAHDYWSNQPNKDKKKPLIETLIDGKIKVIEIVEEYPLS